ncbi:hypothetical protein HKBW3S44_00793 [Candidatus Hakubella thermalkaliphila]|uniref:CBS domain-containing protein n=1 Tax=Candidatus Hakubella thermalkaliphila TaxID=2754717 RepID=A0A6V8PY62_9ACTN|nr:CBS domain-containing protein [Candidatus Hakubella thermalkaliphila]GFP23489.1 hypothetical protein HKBW3S09_00956 [Candidatus Hakubella thermalkaliphila]GFP30893.1 hypothetical protein HKBW3S34_01812 [Candidatus Hakubella thermalkaliphila]GFP37113.1 hypothetical protein HKBW3S44_00793 [Candidatus Hakubella thermalkaliphila]GFP38593.1 hypothetical protein HKBW3S47_00294 [Candidatus Hakubella thermalkaliphila]GFP43594.1 hypothetical protein HKBW3C_02724 [Candidatus Hakubella thermalkaliphil
MRSRGAGTRTQLTKLEELLRELRVEEVMTRRLVSVSGDFTMAQVKELLRKHRISGVPVLEGEALVGVVSIEDVTRALEQGEMGAKVRDRMSREVITVFADEPAVEAVKRFAHTKVGRLPVLDRGGKVVGILTPGDPVGRAFRVMDLRYREQEQQRWQQKGLGLEDLLGEGASLVLRFRVQGEDFAGAGKASVQAKRVLGRLGLDPGAVRRATIAAYEAEMNLIIHTRGGELTLEATPHSVVVEAVDKGPGIVDVEQALQPGFSTAPEWVCEMGFGAGMGLNNIQSCADEFEIESEVGRGTRVRAVVHLSQSGRKDRLNR